MSTKCHVTLYRTCRLYFSGVETSVLHLFIPRHLLHSRFSRAVDVLQNCAVSLLRVPPDLSDEVKATRNYKVDPLILTPFLNSQYRQRRSVNIALRFPTSRLSRYIPHLSQQSDKQQVLFIRQSAHLYVPTRARKCSSEWNQGYVLICVE